MNIVRKLSLAFWPNPAANESAHVDAGNAVVDGLTLGELVQFYRECQTGPTYVMVSRRVHEQLKLFPPHIEDRRQRVKAALEEARLAYARLKEVLERLPR